MRDQTAVGPAAAAAHTRGGSVWDGGAKFQRSKNHKAITSRFQMAADKSQSRAGGLV
jgi:hypothetical protein